MRYLNSFTFPSQERESLAFHGPQRQCYNTVYPFGVIARFDPTVIEMAQVTILYGGNGSGKSTALNVIAEKLSLQRDARYNRSTFFETYVRLCEADTRGTVPAVSRIITSDDVFDYMLNLRALNEGIDERREEIFQEYMADTDPKNPFRFRTMEDYDRLKRVNLARRTTQSQYVRRRLGGNVREQSNGESASFYFTSRIQDGGLYLLDEPENSLSPARQLELLQFLEDSARFFDCQLIIATHSPFLLSMRGARIYDMEAEDICRRRWTELPAIQAYHAFFRQHEADFQADEPADKP